MNMPQLQSLLWLSWMYAGLGLIITVMGAFSATPNTSLIPASVVLLFAASLSVMAAKAIREVEGRLRALEARIRERPSTQS
jgi:hypothetical protein